MYITSTPTSENSMKAQPDLKTVMPSLPRVAKCAAALRRVSRVRLERRADVVLPGKLTIGADLTYPPYDYVQDAQIAGSIRVHDARRHLKLQPGLRSTRFANLILGVNANCVALYVTRARETDRLRALPENRRLAARFEPHRL